MPAQAITNNDSKFHKATLDNTATASSFTGPRDGKTLWVRLETDVSVYVQVGDDVVQGTTDLSTDDENQGPLLAYNTWTQIPAHPRDTSGFKEAPVVFMQASASADIRYRWTREA